MASSSASLRTLNCLFPETGLVAQAARPAEQTRAISRRMAFSLVRPARRSLGGGGDATGIIATAVPRVIRPETTPFPQVRPGVTVREYTNGLGEPGQARPRLPPV